MHIGLILRVLAILFIIISFFMIFPIIFALYYHEMQMIPHFIVPIIMILVISLPIILLTRKSVRTLSTRDGFLLVSLSWIFSALFGALPLYFSASIPHLTDAFFEIMSGFTTTG
nr:TrkH family potassium uptake protein [Spirochaeta sp.]